jgi:hypothetical protein
MPPKKNPLGLNPLQLKTLTLLQALAVLPDSKPGEVEGSVLLTSLPDPHGDHFHLGDAVVAAKDATGLRNPAVWAALERRGLVKTQFPESATLLAAGCEYDTGLTNAILHRASH